MVTLLEGGAYLLNGTEIIPDNQEAAAAVAAKTGKQMNKEEASKETISYGILKSHNTSGNMDSLKIKFDKLTSHDITFVGIIQTARASGLTKFPIPYVLTNCHNSLCAVGGTINEDDHYSASPVQRNTAAFTYPLIRRLSTSSPEKCWQAAVR